MRSAVKICSIALVFTVEAATAQSGNRPKPECDLSCQTREYVEAVERANARRGIVTQDTPPTKPRSPRLPLTAELIARHSKGWRITQIPGRTCQANASFDGGTELGVEFDPSDGGYFVYLSNKNWASIVPEKTYAISYMVSDSEWTDKETKAVKSGNGSTKLLSGFDESFAQDFVSASQLTIKYEGKIVETLSLSGTAKSLPNMVRCALDVSRKAKVDPFAN